MMRSSLMKLEGDIYHKLKWLMIFRILFAVLLLSSTIFVQFNDKNYLTAKSFTVLYSLVVFIFLLSICYTIIYRTKKIKFLFPYLQIGIDTFCVTLIILITGGFTSFFSFLYLLVIIYSSMIIFRKGSMIMAALCSIQYGILVDLEYFGVITPYFSKESAAIGNYAWDFVFFKVVITMAACFAVAFLSGLFFLTRSFSYPFFNSFSRISNSSFVGIINRISIIKSFSPEEKINIQDRFIIHPAIYSTRFS